MLPRPILSAAPELSIMELSSGSALMGYQLILGGDCSDTGYFRGSEQQ